MKSMRSSRRVFSDWRSFVCAVWNERRFLTVFCERSSRDATLASTLKAFVDLLRVNESPVSSSIESATLLADLKERSKPAALGSEPRRAPQLKESVRVSPMPPGANLTPSCTSPSGTTSALLEAMLQISSRPPITCLPTDVEVLVRRSLPPAQAAENGSGMC